MVREHVMVQACDAHQNSHSLNSSRAASRAPGVSRVSPYLRRQIGRSKLRSEAAVCKLQYRARISCVFDTLMSFGNLTIVQDGDIDLSEQRLNTAGQLT